MLSIRHDTRNSPHGGRALQANVLMLPGELILSELGRAELQLVNVFWIIFHTIDLCSAPDGC